MKVFVTGGSGFVGAEVIKRFKVAGATVSALARSETSAAELRTLGAEVVMGDLSSIKNWQSALIGCDVVIHCAAPVEFWGPWQKFESEIVTASKNLLDVCLEVGVPKFIHISSESALQDSADLMGIDETHPYPLKPNSFYGAAKKLAEIELLKSTADIDIIILRPTFVWGPGSVALKEIATRALTGSFIWVGNGSSAFEAVHIKNLTEAIFLAAQYGKGKEIYFVTDDEPTTVRQYFTDFFHAFGVPAPTKNLPNDLVKNLAVITDFFWRLLAITSNPPLSRFDWAFVGMSRKYNITKIKRDLGYRPIINRSQGFEELCSQIES